MPSFPFGQKDEADRLVSMAPEGSRNLGDLLGENHGKPENGGVHEWKLPQNGWLMDDCRFDVQETKTI